MKFVSNLLGYLASAGHGNATPEQGDTMLQIPGVISPVASIPMPVYNVYQAVVIPASGPPIGSFFWGTSQAMNSSSNTDMITLPMGLWEIDILHRVREIGAVSDETATADLLLQIVNSGVSVFSVISRLNGKLLAGQQTQRKFRTLVTKDSPVIIRTQVSAGLGTTGCFSDLSVFGSKLL